MLENGGKLREELILLREIMDIYIKRFEMVKLFIKKIKKEKRFLDD